MNTTSQNHATQLFEEVERRRAAKGWTIKDLARETDCSYATVRHWRDGWRPLGLSLLRGVSRVWPDLADQAMEAFISEHLVGKAAESRFRSE